MTLGEIIDYINLYNEHERVKAKELIANNYNLATLVATFVLCGMNGQEPPTISTLYPDLFEDTKGPSEEDRIAFIREQLTDFATQANKQRRKQ